MYRHLTLEEREEIAICQAQGMTQEIIAEKLGRNQGTISREMRRNIRYGNEYWGNTYMPCKAQVLADKRAIKQRTKAPLKGPKVFLYVREHLRAPYFWTPEQIAGKLPLDHPGSTISTETIYQYIYGKGKGYKLWQLLPLARKKRMRKEGRRVQRDGKLVGTISIDLRPEVVNKRTDAGHWESDNVIGKQTDQTALSVSVERVSRVTVMTKLADRCAQTKAQAVTHRLSAFRADMVQSLTIDNGKENARLPDTTPLPVYACHAYHSWEKGTVENTNGRIRRFIAKGVSMDTIPATAIKEIELILNNTPRKCLGYLTPYEKMNQLQQLCTST